MVVGFAMSLFILLSASVVVPLYSNIIRATPFFGTSPKKPVQTLNHQNATRCCWLSCTANRRNYNRQRPHCGLLAERRRNPERNATRYTPPSFARREQSQSKPLQATPCLRSVRRLVCVVAATMRPPLHTKGSSLHCFKG
jgi:hypothetical protein